MVRSRSKKSDPLSEHARALTAEIAALESQIRELGTRVDAPSGPPQERGRIPAGRQPRQRAPVPPAPEFEAVSEARLTAGESAVEDRQRYNELGARKFDLPDAWRRLRQKPRKGSPDNARLINYLAAGSIQGLRPLRYEKRVARNRVLVLALILALMLVGIISVFLRH
jgi:hypothetical protein